MTHTSEQIDLIDKVFNFYFDYNFNGERRNPTNNLFAKLFQVDKSTAQFAINQVSEIGHQLQILVAQKFGYGDWEVVKMDKERCLTFQSQGGFKKYFADKENDIDKDLVVNQNIHLGDNFGQIINANQSSFEKVDQSRPTIIPTQAQKQPYQKSLLSITEWIFKNVIIVIITGVLIGYLIFKFKWN